MAEPATLLPPPPSSPVRLVTARPKGSIPPPFGRATGVRRVNLIDLQTVRDARGDLVVAELDAHVPFLVERLYSLVRVPEGADRGGHAHKELEQVLIVLSGGLELVVDDGERRQSLFLDETTSAVYLRPMVWRELRRFRPGTVCAVLASSTYDEDDYLRDYEGFLDELESRQLSQLAPHLTTHIASMYPVAYR